MNQSINIFLIYYSPEIETFKTLCWKRDDEKKYDKFM